MIVNHAGVQACTVTAAAALAARCALTCVLVEEFDEFDVPLHFEEVAPLRLQRCQRLRGGHLAAHSSVECSSGGG